MVHPGSAVIAVPVEAVVCPEQVVSAAYRDSVGTVEAVERQERQERQERVESAEQVAYPGSVVIAGQVECPG